MLFGIWLQLYSKVITLVLWKLSVEEAGQLFFTPLAFLGVESGWICGGCESKPLQGCGAGGSAPAAAWTVRSRLRSW